MYSVHTFFLWYVIWNTWSFYVKSNNLFSFDRAHDELALFIRTSVASNYNVLKNKRSSWFCSFFHAYIIKWLWVITVLFSIFIFFNWIFYVEFFRKLQMIVIRNKVTLSLISRGFLKLLVTCWYGFVKTTKYNKYIRIL